MIAKLFYFVKRIERAKWAGKGSVANGNWKWREIRIVKIFNTKMRAKN
jgi:hypothetical protein